MARYLTCRVCHKKFNAEKEQAFKIGNRAYIHYSCRTDEEGELVPLPQPKEKKPTKKQLEQEGRQEVLDYCEKLFGNKCNYASIGKSLKRFTAPPYNYSYSGIKKTLYYFYEIKKNSIEKANGGINIVPYVYQDSFNYFYSLWEAKQQNVEKNIEDYIPKEEVVHIPSPKRPVKRKRKLFTFLDREGDE